MPPDAARQFDLEPERYAAMINWPKRLAFEEPFYRALFASVGVQRVLDVACGTGHHAQMFHSWGLDVEAADASPEMLAYARRTHGAGEKLNWVQRSFAEPPTSGPFDAAICVGNSLALAADLAGVQRVLSTMLAALRPGGVGVVQNMNLWRLADGELQWQKNAPFRTNGAAGLLIKGVRRAGDHGLVELIQVETAQGELTAHTRSAQFFGLRAADLRTAAVAAGALNVEVFGTYDRSPYDESSSPDLLASFRRPD